MYATSFATNHKQHYCVHIVMIKICVLLFVCTGFVCVMRSRQTGLLLTVMAAPLGICRRKALLRLVMERWNNNTAWRNAWGFVWILQRYIHLSAHSLLLLHYWDIPLMSFLYHHQKCCWKHDLSTSSTSDLTKSWGDNVEIWFQCSVTLGNMTPTLTTHSIPWTRHPVMPHSSTQGNRWFKSILYSAANIRE